MCGWTKFNHIEKFDLNYRPDNCERIRIHQVSTEEFIAKYEMKYRPVVITGVCDDWKTMEKWNLEVNFFFHFDKKLFQILSIFITNNDINFAEIGEKIS